MLTCYYQGITVRQLMSCHMNLMNKERGPSPSVGPPWDLILEKVCAVVNRERQITF